MIDALRPVLNHARVRELVDHMLRPHLDERPPKEFRASSQTHPIATGAITDDVAAIAGHSINVQAEHHRQALRRSSEFIKTAIG